MQTPAEQIAQAFHEAYERLAPDHGYKTREASAKPWEEVPESNRNLMTAVVGELLEAGTIGEGTLVAQAYIDSSIRFWRGLRDGTVEPTPPLTAEEAKQKAPQYIDCLQAARVSLLGRQLA